MTMTKEQLKAKVCEAIAARKGDIKKLAENIWAEPELGYKETRTAKKVEAAFDSLGVSYRNQ
ncbi:MAG: amidohydrolase, partial [Morganella morganii]